MKRSPTRKGFTLIETIVYLSLLIILSYVTVSAIASVAQSYRKLKLAKCIETAASVSMERMTREIRGATSVDTTNSILATSTGKLVLNTTDANGYATTTTFTLTNGAVRVKDGTLDIGPLTGASSTVTNLVFRLITTPKTTGVKIEMTLKCSQGAISKQDNFYSTIMMRTPYTY